MIVESGRDGLRAELERRLLPIHRQLIRRVRVLVRSALAGGDGIDPDGILARLRGPDRARRAVCLVVPADVRGAEEVPRCQQHGTTRRIVDEDPRTERRLSMDSVHRHVQQITLLQRHPPAVRVLSRAAERPGYGVTCVRGGRRRERDRSTVLIGRPALALEHRIHVPGQLLIRIGRLPQAAQRTGSGEWYVVRRPPHIRVSRIEADEGDVVQRGPLLMDRVGHLNARAKSQPSQVLS